MKLKKVKNSYVYEGKELKVQIPHRYIRHGYLYSEGASVFAMAVFDYVDEGKPGGMLLPGKIEMRPSSVETITEGSDKFDLLTFHKGDVFMVKDEVVKDDGVVYALVYEFIDSGKYPKFLTYEKLADFFKPMEEVSGVNLGVGRELFETLLAYLSRDDNDVSKEYRHTPMTKPPRVLPMRAGIHVGRSVTSKLIGSHFEDAMTSALVNENKVPSYIENKLRS